MLSFFRNFTKSRTGLIVIFMVLGLIAVAFALTPGVAGLDTITLNGANQHDLVKIGRKTITDTELREQIDTVIRNARAQGQNITMEQLIAEGGVEELLTQMENSKSLVEFSQKNGMFAGKELIDREICDVPVFQGLDGKCSQKAIDDVLEKQRLTPKALREIFETQKYSAWLINPLVAGQAPSVMSRQAVLSQTPNGLVAPYASVLLQRRSGSFGIVRTANLDRGPAPDDKALAAYYNSNKSRYALPPRRIIRYALVKAADIKAQSAATDAEIADAYAKSGARFTASEKRSVRQLVLIDQAAANRVAGEVKAGKSITDQAAALGLSAANFEGQDKAGLAKQTSPAIADAAFAAAQGGVVGPVRSPLGWAVLQVEKIEKIPAKSLEQAKGELATEITTRKTVAAIVSRRQAIDDGIGRGSTFNQLVATARLTPLKTAAVTDQGLNPDDPKAVADPALAAIVRAGFVGDPNDDPQLVQVDAEGSFALVAPEKVIPAAIRPLGEIKAQVTEDFMVNQGVVKGRAMAKALVDKINAGTPLDQAFAGIKDPTIEKFAIKLSEIDPQKASPAVRMAFTMPAKKAKFLQSKEGFIVVYLDQIEEQDASGDVALMSQMRNGIAPQLGQEHAQQFLEAIKKDLKVERNAAAIAAFKAKLARDGAR